MENHGHVCVWEVDQLDVISMFFQKSNCIDVYKQSHQYDLALEKHWITFDPYFVGYILHYWERMSSTSGDMHCTTNYSSNMIK